MRKPSSISWLPVSALALAFPLTILTSAGAHAQPPVLHRVEEHAFDDPEAWALKYFTSLTVLSSLGPVRSRPPGSVEIGVEAASVPHLSAAERTVGFSGTKPEDLNRVSVLVRPRITVGLPAKLSLTAAWVPPVETSGIEANLFALALERPLFETARTAMGLRLAGQVGDLEGDLTCPRKVATLEPGSAANPFGCEAPSEDTATLEYVGLEVTAAWRPRGLRAPTLHLGVGVQEMDLEFQVDALTFGFLDRTRLLTDGTTVSFNGGATWNLGARTRFGVEAYWAPLSVQRFGETDDQTDALLHLRFLAAYRLR